MSTLAALKTLLDPRRRGAVRDLEEAHAERLGAPAAVWLPKGRVGIKWAIQAVGPTHQMEVLTPAFTCKVVHDTLIGSGCRMVIADVEDDFLMTRRTLEGRRTDQPDIALLCEVYGLCYDAEFLEEARPAQRIFDMTMTVPEPWHLERLRGQDVAIISFGLGKCLFAGWGGMLFAHDVALVQRIRELREASLDHGDARLEVRRALDVLARCLAHENWLYGISRRVLEARRRRSKSIAGQQLPTSEHDIGPSTWCQQASMADRALIARHMLQLESMAFHRRRLETCYRELLADQPGLRLPPTSPGPFSHFPVRVEAVRRGAIREFLFHEGIDCGTLFALLRTVDPAACPVSAACSREVLLLPINMDMDESAAKRVANRLVAALGRA